MSYPMHLIWRRSSARVAKTPRVGSVFGWREFSFSSVRSSSICESRMIAPSGFDGAPLDGAAGGGSHGSGGGGGCAICGAVGTTRPCAVGSSAHNVAAPGRPRDRATGGGARGVYAAAEARAARSMAGRCSFTGILLGDLRLGDR